MDFSRSAKRFLKKALASRGYVMSRLAESGDEPSFQAALERLAGRGIPVGSVVDIGASDGAWSEALMRIYPQASYLLIEANPLHEAALSRFCSSRSKTDFIIAAAGEKSGTLYFDSSDPFSGQASEAPSSTTSTEVQCVSIDDQVSSRALEGSFLIKLDTHGFELPILRGAGETLKNTSVLIIECYNFKISPECLRLHEMIAHMETLGFRCIDLFDPLYRPHDHAFWQCDLVFVRSDRPEFEHNKYL